MTVPYSGGLNFSWPQKGDVNWDGTVSTALTTISTHDHSGGGNGAQLTSNSLANNGVSGLKIRLTNAQYLRALSVDAVTDVNLLRLDSNDILEIARVSRFSSTETKVASGAISTTTSLTILNGASLAMTLAAGQEGQIKWVVNIASTPATITPSPTLGANEVTLYQYGAVMYAYVSGEWRFIRGNPQGTTTNDNATAGDVGESISSTIPVGSKVGSFTTGVAKNVTSISLTPGDWDVSAIMQVDGTLTGNWIQASIVSTSGVLGLRGFDTASTPTMPTANIDISLVVPALRVSLSATTTYFLVGSVSFSAGTPGAWGKLAARRVR